MNYFGSDAAAVQYVRGRPYFHGDALQRIVTGLGIAEPLEMALDIGCGTGLSTRALLPVAREIVGVDISEAMIAQAERTLPAEAAERIRYVLAPAEDLPFPDAWFDLATISCAFHWFDREETLSEVRRVLKDSAAFAVYGTGFSGILREAPDFERWAHEVHTAKFPIPPRGGSFGAEGEEPTGFELLAHERYSIDVPMTAEQLVEYLMSQSNAIDLLERGVMTEAEARDWLRHEVEPYFVGVPPEGLTAVFRGRIWMLRRRYNRDGE